MPTMYAMRNVSMNADRMESNYAGGGLAAGTTTIRANVVATYAAECR